MLEFILAFAVASAYGLCATMQGLTLAGRARFSRQRVIGVAAIGTLFHFSLIASRLISNQQLNIQLFEMTSTIAWLVMSVLVFSSLRKPVEPLFTGAAPVALMSVITLVAVQPQERYVHEISTSLSWHIFLSLLAYSIFMLAIIQAALLWMQVHLLKRRRIQDVIDSLPPLQTMDALLIEMIWLGMILLTVALPLAIPSLTDVAEQHLIHKIVFALCGWAIFAILLLGHHRYGWQGAVTSRWTLIGAACLILSYSGSKFVLEVLLNS